MEPTGPQQPTQTQRPSISPTTTSPQTYPPRPTSLPSYPSNPSEQGTHIGVQPPSQQPGSGPQVPDVGPEEPGFGPQQPGSGPQQPGHGPQQPSPTGHNPQYPFAYPQFIIVPYPIALSGVPGGCPCYYMESQNNGTQSTQGTQPPQAVGQPAQQHPQAPQGQQFQGGYIPVELLAAPLIFYPACGGNGQHVQQQVQQMFTGAVPVPYACDACAKQQAQQQQGQNHLRKRVNRRRRISTGSK